jgi:hypothetical protein
MKSLILLLTTTASMLTGWSQTETTVWNSKTYYVYPYQQEVEYNNRLFRQGIKHEEKLHRDSLNREVISSEIIEIETLVPFDKNLKKS